MDDFRFLDQRVATKDTCTYEMVKMEVEPAMRMVEVADDGHTFISALPFPRFTQSQIKSIKSRMADVPLRKRK